jgi:osmotically-inducible protein OsmY
VKARPTSSDVAHRIQQALARQADREAKRVQVDVDGATVTLRGSVHAWQERDAAQWAAWSAPGVRCVVNELRITR